MTDTKVDVSGTPDGPSEPQVTYTNRTMTTSYSTDPVVPATPANGQSDPKVYTEADIEAARRQEKDKLYKRLETMQETVKRLEAESLAKAEAEEKVQREAQEAAKRKLEDEMSAKDLLAQKEQEWQNQLNMLNHLVDEEKALRLKETEFAQLMEFRQQTVQAYSDRVAPQLLDLIMGETPEEITASAEDMAARSEQILAQTSEALQTARQQSPTVRVTAPAAGENSGAQRSFNPEEIRNMSMQDYAKHRRSLLGQGADGPKNRGLFG